MDKSDLRTALIESREALRAQVNGLSQAQATARPAADEWSAIEVLAHLVDTDYFYLGEALALRDTAGHHFQYFDDTAWKLSHLEVRRLPPAGCLNALALSHLVFSGAWTP